MKPARIAMSLLLIGGLASVGLAQTNEELLRKIEALQGRVNELESQLQNSDGDGLQRSALETRINALTEKMEGGTLKSAADPITIIGEFRYRWQASLGDNAAGTTPPGLFNLPGGPDDEHDGTWTDVLMRLGFEFGLARDVTAYTELRAQWAFGSLSSTSNPLDSSVGSLGGPNADQIRGRDVQQFLFVHQAWIDVTNLFCRPELSTRIGRQEIVLGQQFQFGNADWYDGFSFDAVRADWRAKCWSLTAFGATLQSFDEDENQFPSFFNSHDDDQLYAAYFSYTGIKNHEIDAYYIYVDGHGGAIDNGSGNSIGSLGNYIGDPAFFGTAYYHTFGARVGGLFNVACGLDYNVEAAYQTGTQNAVFGGEFDIDALTAEATIGITFTKATKFRVFARALYAEGPGDDELGYVPLYPNRHSHRTFRDGTTGPAEARYGLFDLMPMTNVLSGQIGFHFDPCPEFTLGATAIYAMADDDGFSTIFLRDPAGGSIGNIPRSVFVDDEDYGFEVDVWGEYRYSDQLTFGAGAAFLFPDDAGEQAFLVDDDLQFLGYLQARVVF